MKPANESQLKVRPIQIIALLFVLGGIYFLLPQAGELKTTLKVLEGAHWGWVVLSLLAAAATYWTMAYIQYAAGSSRGNFNDMVKLQLAGSFMNHFLPYSVGTIGLVTDYYHHKLHERRPQAVILASIPTVSGAVIAVLILAVASPLTLLQLNQKFNFGQHSTLIWSIIAVTLVLAAMAVFFYWQNLVDFIKEAVKGFKVLGNPLQVTKIVAATLATMLIASLSLYWSLEAVRAHLPLATVITLYLAATFVGEVAPTPGGLGAIETVLVFGTSAAGLSIGQAFVATLIYRFVTFWLPLIPGGYFMVGLRKQTHGKA